MKLPPLKALPVFEAVARLNSFSRAAQELHISQSAVSHQIRLLEDYLGEALFVRNGRYLSLTEEGKSYFETVASALSQIERASEQLQGHEDMQVRLALFSSFAVRWLIPRLPGLQRQYPQLNLTLEMMSAEPQLSDRISDCFITLQHEQRGFTFDLIYSERLFPVCSRTLWQRLCADLLQQGLISSMEPESISAEHLKRLPLLSTYSIFGEKGEDWRRWFQEAGTHLPDTTRYQHFSHMLLTLEAARHHQGIALTNDYMYIPSEDPDLVMLPTHIMKTHDRFYVAYKSSRRQEPGIQILRRWLNEQARASGLLGPY